MTQPPNVGSKKSMGKKSTDQFGSQADVDAEHLNQYAKNEQEEKDYERASEIDFDDNYSDDDENIPFKNPKEVINYLHALEDDNLFKVDNLQTDDETLEQIKLNSEREIAKMQAKIAKTEANIQEQ